MAFAVTRSARRLGALVGLLLLAANAPWIVAGFLHAGTALTDPAGARAFALHAEGAVPAPLAALGLGGIWNSEAVLPSRTGLAGWVWLVAARRPRRCRTAAVGYASTGRRDVTAYAVCWLVGWGTAVLGWALPDQMAWVVSHVPGGGLVRDGSRLLALCAPALVVGWPGTAPRGLLAGLATAARPATVGGPGALPVALLPDAALGLAGRLAIGRLPG